ncbi:sigma factor [Alkalibacter mobilis]|uniref:sigma factor n=1 Tax=Alkalibacter mobilis TaxID=2787712 RepID=UPI00189F2292|nr:sigma factor [Alkalibacter mobilis]MBF7097375.1 hypothetical protein [Alkalibacter mobilis]
MRDIDKRVIEAANDREQISDLVKEYEFFILSSARKTVKGYLSKDMDEWSVALNSFVEAVQKYEFSKGSFISFAEKVIRSRLIDYYRSQNKFKIESNLDEIEEMPDSKGPNLDLQMEIEAANQKFRKYGFSFFDLTECSPKAKKTKQSCEAAVAFMMKNPVLISNLKQNGQLPIKIIEKNAGIPRKILERHRKYLIAVIEILTGDYDFLSEYLKNFKEDAGK